MSKQGGTKREPERVDALKQLIPSVHFARVAKLACAYGSCMSCILLLHRTLYTLQSQLLLAMKHTKLTQGAWGCRWWW